MDFNQLMARMKELDQPVAKSPTQECGEPMGMTPNMGMPPKADTPPPSMSVNLNAQGMDNIEQLLKLVTKVNPDMEKPAMPPLPMMGAEPSIMSIKPELPPLKMLPDLSDEPADKGPMDIMNKPDDGDDGVDRAQGDLDNDGDHDMDDHDMEKDEPKEKESFGNSLNGSEPEEQGNPFDAEGDDINKPKQMFKRSQPGDNPMAVESTDLRAQIRAELLRRLNEAKGAK